MNYDFISREKPLPYYYKIIALVIIIVVMLIGLYLKITNSRDFFEYSPLILEWILMIALFIFISSKDKTEDERNHAIRLQFLRLGFRLLMMMIIIYEAGSLSDNDHSLYMNFDDWVTGILAYIAIFSELSKNSNILEIFEKNRALNELSALLTIFPLSFLNQWLWSI